MVSIYFCIGFWLTNVLEYSYCKLAHFVRQCVICLIQSRLGAISHAFVPLESMECANLRTQKISMGWRTDISVEKKNFRCWKIMISDVLLPLLEKCLSYVRPKELHYNGLAPMCCLMVMVLVQIRVTTVIIRKDEFLPSRELTSSSRTGVDEFLYLYWQI